MPGPGSSPGSSTASSRPSCAEADRSKPCVSIQALGVQTLGTAAICGTAFTAAWISFKIIDKVIGLRASEHDQDLGLDFTEHAANAYPYFDSSKD